KQKRFGDQTSHLWLLVASVLIAVIGTVWVLDIPGTANPVLANDDSDVPSVGVIERVSEPNGEIEKEQAAAAPDEQANTTAFSFVNLTFDFRQASDELVKIWGKSWAPVTSPLACEHAATVGLVCLRRQGTLTSMEFLNRPVFLVLQDGRGRETQVVLKSLEG